MKTPLEMELIAARERRDGLFEAWWLREAEPGLEDVSDGITELLKEVAKAGFDKGFFLGAQWVRKLTGVDE